jgi:tetratricopeptide (TPR) repeat protein
MGYIDLKKINLDELVGVVTMYPWFGGAHVELCRRMSKMGGDAWGVAQYADAAMYVGAREKLSYLMSASQNHDWSDADVDQILKTYLPDNKQDSVESVPLEKRQVYVVGGDYFSQADYEQVRRSDDNVFSRYAAKAKADNTYEEVQDPEFDLFTETLAQIYAEQGYYEQAKSIYSKLILAYPEKSAYFAALIQKLEELI